MPEVWCWYKDVYGRNRSLWSAVRIYASKHVDFCRGFVLSTAERSRVTYFKSDKAYGVLLFHRAMSVRDGKARSRAILVFFGLDPGNSSSILGLGTMLRKASEARVDRRLRRYYLIVMLLPNVFTLACLPLSSI